MTGVERERSKSGKREKKREVGKEREQRDWEE